MESAQHVDVLLIRLGGENRDVSTSGEACVSGFHNRLRNECLNQEVFLSVTEARVVTGEWRSFFNRVHPHSGLGFQSPDSFARITAQLESVPRT